MSVLSRPRTVPAQRAPSDPVIDLRDGAPQPDVAQVPDRRPRLLAAAALLLAAAAAIGTGAAVALDDGSSPTRATVGGAQAEPPLTGARPQP